ncbi:MAG: tetratricopeptide repeat protein [Bacteroidota bacterium]
MCKSIFVLILGGMLVFGTAKGDIPTADSLLTLLEDRPPPRERVDLLIKLGAVWYRSDPAAAFAPLREAIATEVVPPYPQGRIRAWSRLVYSYLGRGDFDSARVAVDHALNLAGQIPPETCHLSVQQAAAALEIRLGNYQAGNELSRKGYDLAVKLESEPRKATFCTYLGVTEDYLGRRMEAIEWYRTALPIYEKLDDPIGLQAIYTNIGIIYGGQELYGDALTMFRQAAALQEEKGTRVYLPSSYLNIAQTLARMEDVPGAMKNFRTCLRLAEEIGQPHVTASALEGMGICYRKMDSLDAAFVYAQRSVALHREIANPVGLHNAMTTLASLHHRRGNEQQAVNLASEAYAFAQKNTIHNILANATSVLSLAHTSLGNSADAYRYLKENKELNDSLLNAESIRRISDLATRYDYEKRAELKALEQDQRDALQAAELDRQFWIRNLFMAGFFGLMLIVIGGLIAYRRIRQINRKLAARTKEIGFLNDNLECLVADRTAELDRSQEQLQDYLFTNSHRVRGPIVRILGLLQLWETGQFATQAELVQMLEYIHESAQEADRVVFEIGHRLEPNLGAIPPPVQSPATSAYS